MSRSSSPADPPGLADRRVPSPALVPGALEGEQHLTDPHDASAQPSTSWVGASRTRLYACPGSWPMIDTAAFLGAVALEPLVVTRTASCATAGSP